MRSWRRADRRQAVQPVPPQAQDHVARGVESGIQIDGSDHSLHRVGQQCLFAPSARQHLGSAQLQHIAQADFPGHARAGLALHQRVVSRCKLPLAGLQVGAKQRLGHHQAQHPVAQEFQPLVVRPRRRGDRAVGQRAHQQFGPREVMPKPAHEGPDIGRRRHSTALKKRSARQVQKYSSDRPAELNMIRSARPIR